MSYFKVVKYTNYLYQFCDPLGVLSTLVIGNNKALLFDTCYGIGDLNSEVKSITNKELIIVNSHGHMDHSSGNYQFKEVFIHKDDLELVKKHNSTKWRQNNIKSAKHLNVLPNDFDELKYLNQNEGNLKELNIGDIFDLGDITCEVCPLPGHTHGSIALYIKEWKLMLVSDGTCPFIWMFLEESTNVSTYVKALKNILTYDFDSFLVGHGARMMKKSRMFEFLNIASTIDISKSVKVSFNNFENCNAYCYTTGTMYNQDDCGIVFDPDKL